jgi:hypothetical protein
MMRPHVRQPERPHPWPNADDCAALEIAGLINECLHSNGVVGGCPSR